MGCDSADQRGSRSPKGTQEAIDLMGSAQRRANVFPIESAHLDEVRVECSSEERERRAKAAQAESVVKRMEAENDLRSELGKAALKCVKWQLVACNTLVVAYTARLMWLQREIPTEVIISWMGATTAEIIGILWVIARSLFPFQDEHRSADLEKSGGGRICHPRR